MKYVDTNAIMCVIGCVYQDLSLLGLEDKYNITEDDLDSEFHKILFGTAYHLFNQGAKNISVKDVEDFLINKTDKYLTYQQSGGASYVTKLRNMSDVENFDVYYLRMKKMSLLRAYDQMGIDVSDIYEPKEVFNTKKKAEQEEFMDNCSLQDIIDRVDSKIEAVKNRFIGNENVIQAEAGDDIVELIQSLEETPDVGAPLYGDFVNTVTRGARLNKYYIRSAPTGMGKSRSMVADVCFLSCEKIYDKDKGWVDTDSAKQSTLYISVELDLHEVQTMMLAFVSGVNEEHILNGTYEAGERQRVLEAGTILQNADIHIEVVPDFTMKDIESIIKRNIRENKVKYIFFDYLSSSLGILKEISQATKGMKLREDNVLFMLSTKLKDICNQYGVFLMTATQLSNDWMTTDEPNQNLLRGARAIADKVDVGMHILPIRKEDLKNIESILDMGGFDKPDLRICVYKNRRARYKNVILWCKADLGTCRIMPIFCTDYNYNLLNVDNLKIKIEKENTAF